MDDKTKLEVLWEERAEMKTTIEKMSKDITDIKLLLATARGGWMAMVGIGGLIGSVVTFIGNFFMSKH